MHELRPFGEGGTFVVIGASLGESAHSLQMKRAQPGNIQLKRDLAVGLLLQPDRPTKAMLDFPQHVVNFIGSQRFRWWNPTQCLPIDLSPIRQQQSVVKC